MVGDERLAVVAGATGYLGGHVARALHDDGWRVRALVRDPKRRGHAGECFDEVFVGQATRPETLAGLCDGARFVFSSLGIRHFGRRPSLWEVDHQANLHVVRRAEEAGVPCFAFTSVLHAPQMRDRFPIAEARERVVDALRAGPMHTTVLRPTGFFNDMQEIFEMARGGRVWLLGDGDQPFNPVHGADLAELVVDAARRGPEAPTDIDAGGPDDLTLHQVGELAFAALGKPARFSRVPVGVVSALAALARPFSANAHALLTMFVVMSERGGVASTRGRQHLADFYAELAAQGPADGR